MNLAKFASFSLVSLLMIAISGCASNNLKDFKLTMPARVYTDAPASALAFDPPIMHGEPASFLPRSEREATAFMGYDAGSATYFNITTDDRIGQPSGFFWLERRATIQRTGVIFP